MIQRLISTAVLALAASLAFAGGSIYQATLVEQNQKTGEVSTDELRRILADGSAIVLDARPRAEFVGGHIPGARNLGVSPSEAVAAVERLVDGDRGKALILYCNGPFCQASRRMSDRLVAAGFTNIRRYQLGMPVWRALGGPTAVEIEGFLRVHSRDQTAVFLDARSDEAFAAGSLPGAKSLSVDKYTSGALKKAPLPEDDFNTRILLFGQDAAQARALAEALSKRPWHNVSYFPGTYEQLRTALSR